MTSTAHRFPLYAAAALLAAALLAPRPAHAVGQLAWECRNDFLFSPMRMGACITNGAAWFKKVGCKKDENTHCNLRGNFWVCVATSEVCYRTYNGVCPAKTHQKLSGPGGYGTVCKNIGAAARAPPPSTKWGKSLLWQCKDGGGNMDGSDYNLNTAGECFSYAKRKVGTLGCKVSGGGCQRSPGASRGSEDRPNFSCSMQSANCFSGSYNDCAEGWHQRSTQFGGVCVKGRDPNG